MKFFVFLISLLVTTSSFAADPNVKKSDSGICHDKKSASYTQTKKFVPFESMEECTKSGGRAPVNAKEKEAADPIKKSETGICHDKTSASYSNTNKFTPYRSMDECLKSGGKPIKK
ncbi:MAG: hypothetical protein KGP13_12985 [Burkholderiales bacterium]|nr:hypothetical protein [Burkholderiales bacterium]